MTSASAPGGATSNDGRGYMTEERLLIRDTARAFTMKEVLPVANRLDPEQGMIPMELRQKMADLGYFGIRIPEEYGGLGLGAFEYCLITEQLARGWMSVASIIARGQAGWLRLGGAVSAKNADRMRRAARGEYLQAAALSEPATGSDLASISCRAVRDGDHWVITGSKYWCTFADGADYITVFARTAAPPSADKRHLGISAFLIDKPRGMLPENCQGSPIPKIGYYGWNTYELSFQGTRVPGDALIGEEGKAFYLMAYGLETARAHTAARSIGLAQGALETPSPTPRNANSSDCRSPSSRRSASKSRPWQRKSRRLGSCCTTCATKSIRTVAATRKHQWRNTSPPKWLKR